MGVLSKTTSEIEDALEKADNIETTFDTLFDTKFDTKFESEFNTNFDTKFDSEFNTKFTQKNALYLSSRSNLYEYIKYKSSKPIWRDMGTNSK